MLTDPFFSHSSLIIRPTKTGSKICCTHLSYTFSESWVRNDSVGTCPKKFSLRRISLATRVLPASPNFGQAKHGQNGPAATDCQQCICCPICGHHFTHWTHPDISLRFRAGGRRLKNFRFSRICMSPWWKSSSACCGLNFDATDLPNSSFEPLYPKLFRGTPEVDLVSTVWPPDLPKVRWCQFLAAKKRCF